MAGPARALLVALLAPVLVALLVAPAWGRGGKGHGDWDTGALMPPLPPREDAARVARFVTHVCDWGALATISTQEAVLGQPFADVLSLSDGPPGAGSGVPYFYLSPLQQSVGNLQVSEAGGPAFPLWPAPCPGGTAGSHPCPCAPVLAGWALQRPRYWAGGYQGISYTPPPQGYGRGKPFAVSPRVVLGHDVS